MTFADRLQCATLTATTQDSKLYFSAASLASPHTISTTLTINGASGHLITLGPQNAATTWYLSPPTGTTVTYVSVSYSYSDKTILAQNSTNGGNNTNWSFGKNFSGTVYSDEGSTPIGAGRTVAISVNGAAAAKTATTDANGQWTLSSVEVSVGDVIIVYLDGNTEQGCTVTVVTNADLTGLNIYQNRVIVRYDYASGLGYLTNANLSTADNTDSDIKYSVSSNNLTLEVGQELFIWSGDTYKPGGNVTTPDLDIRGTLNAESNTFNISGNFSNSGTFQGDSPFILSEGYIGTRGSPITFSITGILTLNAKGMQDYVSISVKGTGSFSFQEPIAGFVIVNGRVINLIGQQNFRASLIEGASSLYQGFFLPQPWIVLGLPSPEEIERAQQKWLAEKIKHWAWDLLNNELARADSPIMQELFSYYYLAEKAQKEKRLKESQAYYEKLLQAGKLLYKQAEEYINGRIELENKLKEDNALALEYYRQGRLLEAKQLWQKIITEAEPKPIFLISPGSLFGGN